MCGIAGIINTDSKPVEEDQVRQMMRLIKHRGPDDEGVFTDESICLGFVRLSIIDLSSAGHQPMLSHDGRYVIVFNGEIYNYIELREQLKPRHQFTGGSDTEVILAAYQEWGEECLHRFNGMFALVIYDRAEKSVFGARDRFGVKPFYYSKSEGSFMFSSEIPPLLSCIEGKAAINNQAVFDYLAFNRTDQTEATFFKDIVKLQHGHKFTIRKGKLSMEKWYDLKQQNAQGLQSPEEFKDLFSSSIKLRLRSDVPLGVTLSGGLDSSAIVSTILNDTRKNNLKTFSAIYGKNERGDESSFINLYKPLVSEMYTVNPTGASLLQDMDRFVCAHAEPVPGTSVYAQYKVMELVSKHVVVALDGQGADEALAGYPYFFGFYFKDLLKTMRLGRLALEISAYMKTHRSLFGIKTFAYFLLPNHLKTSLRSSQHGYINERFVSQYSVGNNIVSNLYDSDSLQEALYNHFEYKLEHLLKWSDINSMQFSVENRSPFLDYTLVEKVLASPASQKINHGTSKYILREAMKGILPDPIRLRQDKVGFETPEHKWFREENFRAFIQELIHSESFRSRPYFNAEKVQRLYSEHLQGKINIGQEIWKWINLELWCRRYVD
jgi:asparagine synthase (glutamine-hydrolysing)